MRQLLPKKWASTLILTFFILISISGARGATHCEGVFTFVRARPERFQLSQVDLPPSAYALYSYQNLREKDRPLELITSDKEKIHRVGKRSYRDRDFQREYIAEPADRLKIEAVMRDFQLTRVQAVELQAILRKHFHPATNEQFARVVDLVRRGVSLSGTKYENLKEAKFIVAIDVDGTLLDQDTKKLRSSPSVHDFLFSYGDGFHAVTMVPGWQDFFRGIKKMGGSIVLFSRNSDKLIQELFHYVQIDGVPVSEYVDAIYSSGHMVVVEEDQGLLDFMPLYQVVKKDLRILDLKKTILIDDNPDYVLQLSSMRKVQNFNAKKLDSSHWRPSKSGDSESTGEYSSDYGSDFGSDYSSAEPSGFMRILSRMLSSEKAPAEMDPEVAIQKEKEKFQGQFQKILSEIENALEESSTTQRSFSASYAKFARRSQKSGKKEKKDE